MPQAPKVIATACPYCAVMISDALKAIDRNAEIATRDIAELVADAMMAVDVAEAVDAGTERQGTARLRSPRGEEKSTRVPVASTR